MKKVSYLLIFICVFILCSCSQKNYIPEYTFNDIASSKGYILACGDNGLVSVTEDLVSWSYEVINKDVNFYDVTSNKGVFYVLGTDSSSNCIIYSYSPVDGLLQTEKCDEYFKQLESANGHLFSFTRDSIMMSDDGVKWEKVSFPAIYDETAQQYQNIPECMLYDGMNYIVSGGGNFIAASPDLIKWDFVNDNTLGSMCSFGIASNGKQDVVVGDHLFIGYKNENNLWSFNEKINNIERVDDCYTLCLTDVAADGSKFVAVGQRGLILIREDDTWNISDSGVRDWLKKIVWNGKYFVVLSEKGFLYSKDGQTWSSVE